MKEKSRAGSQRLSEVFASASDLPLDDRSRYVCFSDCHRGDNSWADDFADNENVYLHALSHYYDQGFTYIEIGDGDELWENKNFAEIRRAHSQVFALLAMFYRKERCYLIYGNHDLERKDQQMVAKSLYRYSDEDGREEQALLEGITVYEGLRLRHRDTGHCLFLVHGHQAELLNDRLWVFARFYVRYFWRYAQLFGVKNPTSPANNSRRRIQVERTIDQWVRLHNQPLVAGHTHRAHFALEGDPPYFNDGNCVDRRRITAIEIRDGQILLVEWSIKPRKDGLLYVVRDILGGPRSLRSVFGARA